MVNKGLSGVLVISLVVSFLGMCLATTEGEGKEYVLTLDHTNLTDTLSKHDFIVVEFYAPWCGHCKKLAPEYEKAASVLSSHEPPVVLAKVNLDEEANKPLAGEYQVQGFPTLKIFRNGGKNVEEYKGPREADGIVSYLKKQLGPASAEIKSAADVSALFDEKKIFIVGVFPKFSGEEFDSFIKIAESMRSDYDFGHTLDAKHLPHGELVSKPTLRLFKPFDELYVDIEEFEVEAVKKFIEQSSIPLITVFDENPDNHPYVNKFFSNPNAKVMLFLNFSTELKAFESIYRDAAESYKGQGLSFLIGDADSSDNAFQYFGLTPDQAPLLIIQHTDSTKFLKPNIQAGEVAPWLKDYKESKVKPYIRSEPIPEVNDEPVKVVVTDSLQDMVFNSGKNVLLEFYAPWCGHCKKLAPILDEVAVSFEKDADVLIAKLDATVNDVPGAVFEVQGYPTLYFRSAAGKLSTYEGDRTKDAIIEFINKNRDQPATHSISAKPESVEEEVVKDEL